MADWSKRGLDRYDELMARRAALESEIWTRLAGMHDEAVRQLPLAGTGHAVGGHTDGIRLAPDGSLDATLHLTDAHGVVSSITLRADPGGAVTEYRPPQRVFETAPVATDDETNERRGAITALVREHLPPEAVDDFLAMLHPAIRLLHAGEGDAVIAQLGGLPTLPINSWPVWEGHGPLAHVMSFDCAPVADMLPDLGLPGHGRLAFFYFDPALDDVTTVGSWDPSTSPGFRVLHVQPERSTGANITNLATPAPPGLSPYPVVPLTGVLTLTWPSRETPMAQAVWDKHGLAGPRPGAAAAPVQSLYEALWELPAGGYDVHQIGGHPCPQQGPVEMEVEQLRRGLDGRPFDWQDAGVQRAAETWKLLLQVASDDDANMMWGDVGQLYYLVENPGLPDRALFTWQCG